MKIIIYNNFYYSYNKDNNKDKIVIDILRLSIKTVIVEVCIKKLIFKDIDII